MDSAKPFARLDNKSWMNREIHVQFRESAGVKLPRATRPFLKSQRTLGLSLSGHCAIRFLEMAKSQG
jgi:hypothetical protein